jgi:hypothetical protein
MAFLSSDMFAMMMGNVGQKLEFWNFETRHRPFCGRQYSHGTHICDSGRNQRCVAVPLSAHLMELNVVPAEVQDAKDRVVKEGYVRLMEARIVREELGKCWRTEVTPFFLLFCDTGLV